MIFNRHHYLYAPSNSIWNDLMFSNVSKSLTKLLLLFIERQTRLCGERGVRPFVIYCFRWTVKLYLSASIMTLRPMTVRERTNDIKLLLIHIFFLTCYLTRESFQSIGSIVFRPLFYVDINFFYDGSNDKTVICS